MAGALKLTRNQLASFLNDPEQIKQFEKLVDLVAVNLDSGLVASIDDTFGNVLAATQANAASLQDLADDLNRLPPPADLSPLYDRLQALEAVPGVPDLGSVLDRLSTLEAVPAASAAVSGASIAPSAITVTASPFTYQNASGYAADVIVSGGTVTLIEFGRSGAFTAAGMLAGMFGLSPFDSIRVTYTVAPTMTLVTR
jgi:hypothetical protein